MHTHGTFTMQHHSLPQKVQVSDWTLKWANDICLFENKRNCLLVNYKNTVMHLNVHFKLMDLLQCVLIFQLKMIKCEWTEQSLVFVQNNINMKSICSLKSICVAFWNKCWSSRGFRKTDIHEKVTKQWRILSE